MTENHVFNLTDTIYMTEACRCCYCLIIVVVVLVDFAVVTVGGWCGR